MLSLEETRSVETSSLQIGYYDTGPLDGPVVFLLHGWPDDPLTWKHVAEHLVLAGWRVIAPYLRGFGPTRFRATSQRRTGDLASLALDLLELADSLGVQKYAVVGHDWGARAAYIASCLMPERITHVVAISVGWGTNDPTQKISLKQSQNYWYHWLMALDRGADLVRHDRGTFTRYILDLWSVAEKVDDERFGQLLETFSNPDWAEVVLHSYRVRWGLDEPDGTSWQANARIVADPIIRVPTLVIHGSDDPCNDPSTSENKDALFSGYYRREVLAGVGHFPQWEAPDDTAKAILAHLCLLSPGEAQR